MSTFLPPEILEEIFENLHDDKKALHSSLLVNRSWCRNIVPILWRQPFKLLNKPSVELVQTYIANVFDRTSLENFQQRILIHSIQDLSSTSFKYPIFLKSLRTITLTQSIKGWVNEMEIHLDVLDRIFFNKAQLVCYLYSILIKSFTSVQTIQHCSLDHFLSLRKQIKFPTEYPKLLRSLRIEIKYDDDILFYLSQIRCNALEEIWIGPLNSGIQLDGLSNLIKHQNSLKDFRLYGPKCEWLVVTIDIISALITQYQTLHTVRFSECSFPFDNLFDHLGICQNLKNLEFHTCDFPEPYDL